MPTVRNVIIAVKSGSVAAEQDARTLCSFLETSGLTPFCVRADDPCVSVPDAAVAVLGGDGTMIGVIRTLIEHGAAHMPVLGINYGRVGFLAEFSRGDVEALVAMLIKGEYAVCPCMALRWEVCRRGEILHCGIAVNDATVARRTVLARVCALSIGIDGIELGAFRADGVIVSAPSGTSGYAYSAGGSLVHPSLQAVSVTAVSPFLSHFPNMVLPPDKVVEISVQPNSVDACLTLDGQKGVELHCGDVVRIRGISDAFSMIVPDGTSYFCRLRQCGFTFEPSEYVR